MKLVKLLSITAALALVAGCASHGGGSYGGSYGNYKCTAAANGYTATGWATDQSNAEENALDKCKEHTNGGSCQIVNCNSE